MAKDEGKKSNKGLLIGIIVLLVIVVIGVGVGVFAFSKLSSGTEKNIVEEVLTLEEIIVNINDPSLKKYAKFSLAMSYDSKNKKIGENINANLHKIKDSIISIFKDKKVSDIESSQGIEELKQQLKNKINEILGGDYILSIYFTNLLIH